MAIVGVYVSMLVAFLAIDAVMLKFVMYPLFARHVGDLLAREHAALRRRDVLLLLRRRRDLSRGPAGGSRRQRRPRGVQRRRCSASSPTAPTNSPTWRPSKGWAWPMLATDTIWGGVLTGVTAVVGYLAARWLL